MQLSLGSTRPSRVALCVALGLLASSLGGPGAEPGSATSAAPTGTAAFSLRLYRAIVETDDQVNLIESPYSVAEALSMLASGTAGNSKQQLDTAVAGKAKTIDPAQRAELHKQLTSVGTGFGTEVTISNALWTAAGYPIKDPYRATLTQQFAAQSQEVPFATDPDSAIKTINQWASVTTKGLIPQIVSRDSVDTNTAVVLTNAIYFEGRWASQFDPASTTTGRFTLLGGKRVDVQMMRGVVNLRLSTNPRVISLPFIGGYTMQIVVPSKTTKKNLDAAMATLHLPEKSKKYLSCVGASIAIPKWQATSNLGSLPIALAQLGITDVFDPDRADLSPMTAADRLAVTDVVQRAFIDVDERGTKAAAVTAVAAGPVSEEPAPQRCPGSVTIDRPFVYVLKHASGEIIFAGRVDNPLA